MGRAIFVTLLRRLELTLRTKFTPRVLICMCGTSIEQSPLYNSVFCPTNSKIYGKEPRYNETSMYGRDFLSPSAFRYIEVPLFKKNRRF